MDTHQRKFKADINNNYAQKLLSKRYRKFKPKKSENDTLTDKTKDINQIPAPSLYPGERSMIIVQNLPEEKLPKRKTLQSRDWRPSYEKPENWIQPKPEPKPSRGEALRKHHNDITKMSRMQSTWSYTARHLVSATSQSQGKRQSDDDNRLCPMRKLLRTSE